MNKKWFTATEWIHLVARGMQEEQEKDRRIVTEV